jgi:mannose-1-phosphate guanylyltransferase
VLPQKSRLLLGEQRAGAKMVMKAFILAAGEGTRLRPLTNHLPKCLVPIRGIPLLAIWLRQCREVGVHEVLVNLHAHAGAVRQFLQGKDYGLKVRLVEEDALLGSAGTLRANREWVEEDELFWVFYADVLNRADLLGMLRLHRQRRPAATLGVYEVAEPRRCGIVSIRSDGIIQQFVEKPQNPTGNLAFSGLMIGTTNLLDVIPESLPADIGFHVLPRLAGQMLAFPIHDYLLDIGTMENYQRAQETWPGFVCS